MEKIADVIFLRGAPGSGKSTVAAMLHGKLGTPWFEFGWIPEFRRLNPHTEIPYELEERISAENLTLVVRNYLRHGFSGIIVSDLSEKRLFEMYSGLEKYRVKIITLVCAESEIRRRVLTRDNGNEYRDADAAVEIARRIDATEPRSDEYRIDTTQLTPDEVVSRILANITI